MFSRRSDMFLPNGFSLFKPALFFGLLIAISTCALSKSFAQDAGPQGSGGPSAFNLEEERSKLLNHLKTQVEPNLLDRDLKRLKRDVMRLGSFRSEWVKESEKFLAGNSALAELFLYDFSRIKNPRLNQQIINTLLQFDSYQFPTAALAFESDLAQNPAAYSLVYQLLNRVVQKTPAMFSQTASWLVQRNDNSADYFQVILTGCRAGSRLGGELRSQIEDRLASASSDFWTRLVVDDLRSCLRGT